MTKTIDQEADEFYMGLTVTEVAAMSKTEFAVAFHRHMLTKSGEVAPPVAGVIEANHKEALKYAEKVLQWHPRQSTEPGDPRIVTFSHIAAAHYDGSVGAAKGSLPEQGEPDARSKDQRWKDEFGGNDPEKAWGDVCQAMGYHPFTEPQQVIDHILDLRHQARQVPPPSSVSVDRIVEAVAEYQQSRKVADLCTTIAEWKEGLHTRLTALLGEGQQLSGNSGELGVAPAVPDPSALASLGPEDGDRPSTALQAPNAPTHDSLPWIPIERERPPRNEWIIYLVNPSFTGGEPYPDIAHEWRDEQHLKQAIAWLRPPYTFNANTQDPAAP